MNTLTSCWELCVQASGRWAETGFRSKNRYSVVRLYDDLKSSLWKLCIYINKAKAAFCVLVCPLFTNKQVMLKKMLFLDLHSKTYNMICCALAHTVYRCIDHFARCKHWSWSTSIHTYIIKPYIYGLTFWLCSDQTFVDHQCLHLLKGSTQASITCSHLGRKDHRETRWLRVTQQARRPCQLRAPAYAGGRASSDRTEASPWQPLGAEMRSDEFDTQAYQTNPMWQII